MQQFQELNYFSQIDKVHCLEMLSHDFCASANEVAGSATAVLGDSFFGD